MPINKKDLNEAQWEAVSYCDGPSLVIAGAGSGKTRVLTYKVAYLIENGLPPWSILALTFTNKAAREMNERIGKVVGMEQARWVWSGTFHSIFSRILRRECAALGFTSDFTIYDASDSRSLIKTMVKERGLDEKVYKPQVIAARISEAKNALILPEQYLSDGSIHKRDKMDGIAETGKIYAAYVSRCRAANAMDFDDLLLNAFLLFRDQPDVCEKYKNQFQYILVDEYQDTNAAQHRIIAQLTTPQSRVCVVGDDAQSIYAFRGAKIDNILGFQEQYPSARLIKLERNYRSTQTIVDAANSLIRHNRSQIPKQVYSVGEEGEHIRVISAYSDKEESLKVAGEVRRLVSRMGLNYEDIALLYRTNAQSRSFEEAFRSANLPYRIYGGLSFYQRKEIKDILAYFRLIANPYDEEAFKRIINYPTRGIGATTLGKLQVAAMENGTSLWNVTLSPSTFGITLNKGTQTKIGGFIALIESLRERITTTDGSLLAAQVLRETGIGAEILADRTPEGLSRKENVEELIGAITAHDKEVKEETGDQVVPLTSYLSQVSLLTDADQREDDEQKVTLMTIHAAKGLEFDAVFITGMEDDLFPNSNARFYPKEMEEERRLFYVALTRAKRFCYLTYAKSRYRYGQMEFANPSPFLDNIDSRYLLRTDEGFYHNNAPKNTAGLFASPRHPQSIKPSCNEHATPPRFRPTTIPHAPTLSHSLPSLSVGNKVEHERFGIGRVISLEGSGDNAKAAVEFETAGRKNLLLKFAKIRLI